jgi:hypothetical protein
MSTVVDAEAFESEHVYIRRDGRELHRRPCTMKWHARKNRNFWYATSIVRGWAIGLHRMIVDAPRLLLVDHKDRDTLNNRLTNLRLCNHSGNMANTTSRGGASRFKGVRWMPDGGWGAQIQTRRNGRAYHEHLGIFRTEEAAARQYDRFAIARFGEFARLNFPHQ